MVIEGYKAFNNDKTNRYGMLFEEDHSYHVDGRIKFGKNGYHMCEKLCDVFRYFNSNDVCVAKVIGSGEISQFDDFTWGYLDMHSVSDIHICKFLTRNEIINQILNEKNDDNVIKFLITFELTEEEKILFFNKFDNNFRILRVLLYYQYHVEDIFYETNLKNETLSLKKV